MRRMPEQTGTIDYLIVPLEAGATSFCYYENPAYYSGGGDFLPLTVLRSVHDYAAKKSITINFLYGNRRPPHDYEEIIESTNHVKMLPLKLKKYYAEGVFVVNRDDVRLIDALESSAQNTFILRLVKDELQKLGPIVDVLLDKCRRLDLVLPDIGSFSGREYDEYAMQITRIKNDFLNRIKKGHTVELNILTDRLLLHAMNNCNAGLVHLTVGCNGKLYLCPGFYYGNEDDSVGSIDNGSMIKNQRLLRIGNAPICSRCDAYHCKRCLYLNNKLTLEINTPSRQQCVVSHLERDCSRVLRDDLVQLTHDVTAFAPIPELSYFDPLDVLLRDEKRAIKRHVPVSNPAPAVNT